MSNTERDVEQNCDVARGGRAIDLVLKPHEKELGGFTVRRSLPSRGLKMVGPWIFFDHMGPAEFPAGRGINVRPHPHVNLATVSYLFDGEMLHRDSLGTMQVIRPGDINLMVAGRGIVHSERERPEVTAVAHRLHGLQLWLALPEEEEEIEPAFYHYPATDVPTVEVDGVSIRVMMGTAFGVTSPVQTYADTLYVEAHLEIGQCITVPAAEERAVYVVSGSIATGETELEEHSMAIVSREEGVVLVARAESRVAIIGGEKLGGRYIEWNFVSSRKERIEQAKADWRAKRFPSVPGDAEEFIPLPERG